MLSKDQILAREKRAPVVVQVPEWDGEVCVRVLSGNEHLVLERHLKEAGGDTAKLLDVQLAAYLCHEDGTPWFASPDEASALRSREAGALSRIVRAGARANGHDQEAVKGNS